MSSAEYDARFLVRCAICEKELRVINNLHLKTHGLTVDEYRARYPDAPTSSIPCIECGTVIYDSLTVNHNYCKDCKKEVERDRKRKDEKKRWRESHRPLSKRDREIIGDHHYPGLGTTGPTTFLEEIEVNGETRIKGAVFIENWRKDHGHKTNPRTRPQEEQDSDS